VIVSTGEAPLCFHFRLTLLIFLDANIPVDHSNDLMGPLVDLNACDLEPFIRHLHEAIVGHREAYFRFVHWV
jgi:hypothetical protein